MKKQIKRQGDVTLHHVKQIPTNLIPVKGNIIALGEHTGHRHFFNTKQECVFKDNKDQMYVNLTQDTELVHSGPDLKPVHDMETAKLQDKHLMLTIPKGTYLVHNEKEYDPFDEQIKTVLD